MSAEHLSTALFRETRGSGFFRVLSGKNAPFYVDVLDSLEHEASERPDGLAREEVLAIISDTLERHPGLEIEEENGSLDQTERSQREKARLLLDHLLKCRWLEEPPRRDWRRTLQFDAHGATLIAALRKIAWPDAAVFTDKLMAVCALLANEVEISERPWQTVENCLSNVREGLNELRSMQKSVQRFTRRQLEEDTLKGNLSVVFDDYSEQVSHACYSELVRARLPLRLPEAVRRIDDRLCGDCGTMSDMQVEVLRRNPNMDAETARAKVRNALDELSSMLERVLPMADEIDRGTADFSRRSLARFRYLQDVTGERRSEIKAFFERANSLLSGKRLSHHAADLPELPSPRLPEVRLPAGLDSLYSPPQRRAAAEQEAFEDSAEDEDRESGLENMGRALRDSLSVLRANTFVASLDGGKGSRILSADLPIQGESGFTDLISLLLHSESAEARYRIVMDRTEDEGHVPALDSLEGCVVERFSVIKK
ncbi:MAG: Wadjet anti-phage system protein JetA family protein [Luteolibacter sp.]|uniref:Wadjet anti-phage system protein JetA family protein n=1 Tax=Luteolibacter sp. TaxID=1962973 RepID=UPI003266F0D3